MRYLLSKRLWCLALVIVAVAAFLRGDNPLPDGFHKQKGFEQRKQIWELIRSDSVSEPWGCAISALSMLFWNMRLVFDSATDIRPYGGRVAHVQGAYAIGQFVPNPNSPYSGVYNKGAPVIMRFSTATEPSASGGMTPAVAVKHFIDGEHSLNYAAMYTFDASLDHGLDFFSYPLSTHGPRKSDNIGLKLLAWGFDKISRVSATLGGTFTLATRNPDGTIVFEGAVNVPFALVLQPNPELHGLLEDYQDSDVIAEAVRKVGCSMGGKTLYKVLAITGPDYPGTDTAVEIGEYRAEPSSCLVTSGWGDRKLFFQQQMFEKELEWNPAWKDSALDQDFLLLEGLPYKWKDHIPHWGSAPTAGPAHSSTPAEAMEL
eukprot:GDKH01003688.1.p1 GENE.GDKH01003688.1~~GDKH01003688.1.p1  ORF type:complete len:373 (-),score=65.53 GDKH01003688.1:304-1422(-)